MSSGFRLGKHKLGAPAHPDVEIVSPADGEVLTREGAKWKNKAPVGAARELYEVNPAQFSTTSLTWVVWTGSRIDIPSKDVAKIHFLFYSCWVWNSIANNGGECAFRRDGTTIIAQSRRGWLGAIALQDQCLSAIVLAKDVPAGAHYYELVVRALVGGTATYSYNDVVIEVI